MSFKYLVTSSLSGFSLGFYASTKRNDSDMDKLYKQSITGLGFFFAAMKSYLSGEIGTHEVVFAVALFAGSSMSYLNSEQENKVRPHFN